MTEPWSAWAVEALISQAWDAARESRYQQAMAAASRAVAAAEQLDDPNLLVRALIAEAEGLKMLGEDTAALTRYTRVLGLAEDPATSQRLDQPAATNAIARAYNNWVDSARFLTGIPRRKLFEVLDAGDRWLEATGHQAWRAGILAARADVHAALGELDKAIAAGEEALAAFRPGAPGPTLASHRSTLGSLLRQAGRPEEAEAQHRAVLDDPASSPIGRKTAYEGLAWCMLDLGDTEGARRHARAAVRLAEPISDTALSLALDVLVEACRVGGDLEGAWQAAGRYLEVAGRIGGHYRPYHAVRRTLDVALDRGDRAAAERLLAELEEHAAALDADLDSPTFADQVALRRERLEQLNAAR